MARHMKSIAWYRFSAGRSSRWISTGGTGARGWHSGADARSSAACRHGCAAGPVRAVAKRVQDVGKMGP